MADLSDDKVDKPVEASTAEAHASAPASEAPAPPQAPAPAASSTSTTTPAPTTTTTAKVDDDGFATPAPTSAQSATEADDQSESISESVHESVEESDSEHSDAPSRSSQPHRVNFSLPPQFSTSRIVDVTDTAEKPDISSTSHRKEELDTNFFSSTGTNTTTGSGTSESDDQTASEGAQQQSYTETHQFRRRRPLPPHLKALQQNMLNELGQIQVVLENRRVQTMMQNKLQKERAEQERKQQQQQNNQNRQTTTDTPQHLDSSFLANRISTISQRLKTTSDTIEVVSPPGTPMHE